MQKNLYSILILIFILSACSKAKSNRWMVIDLNLKSSVTGRPISVAVSIERRSGSYIPLGEDQLNRESLGQMHDGHFYYEMPISPKDYNWELILRQGGWYGSGSSVVDYRVPLNPNSKNELNIEWTPVLYLTILSVTNSSCYDETDSLWVSYLNPYSGEYINENLFVGCVEQADFRGVDGSYIWSQVATSSFKYRAKKNGIETSGEISYDLEVESFNEFVLEY